MHKNGGYRSRQLAPRRRVATGSVRSGGGQMAERSAPSRNGKRVYIRSGRRLRTCARSANRHLRYRHRRLATRPGPISAASYTTFLRRASDTSVVPRALAHLVHRLTAHIIYTHTHTYIWLIVLYGTRTRSPERTRAHTIRPPTAETGCSGHYTYRTSSPSVVFGRPFGSRTVTLRYSQHCTLYTISQSCPRRFVSDTAFRIDFVSVGSICKPLNFFRFCSSRPPPTDCRAHPSGSVRPSAFGRALPITHDIDHHCNHAGRRPVRSPVRRAAVRPNAQGKCHHRQSMSFQ
jgi:hypothetical protein